MNRLNDGVWCMPQNVGSPGADIIDVALTIDIFNASSFGTTDKERITIDISERAHWGVHATGNQGFGF